MTAELPPIGYASTARCGPGPARRRHAARVQPVQHPLADRRSAARSAGSSSARQRCALVTDGRYAEQAAAELAAAGLADQVDVVVGTTRPQIREHVVAVGRRGRRASSKPTTSRTRSGSTSPARSTAHPRHRHDRELRRVKDRGELARMDARRVRSPTPPSPRWPRCSPSVRPRPTSATSSSIRMRRARRRRPELRHDRRHRARQRGPPAPPHGPPHDRRAATPSSSTSARSSTATTPT